MAAKNWAARCSMGPAFRFIWPTSPCAGFNSRKPAIFTKRNETK